MLVWFGENTSFKYTTGTEQFAYVLIWFVMIAYHVVIYLLPSLTLVLYLLFGGNFILLRWTDNLGMYFITGGTRNQGFNCHVLNSLGIFLLFLRWREGVEFIFWLIYTVMASGLEYQAWKYGVDAARRIDPSWNEHQGFLYP